MQSNALDKSMRIVLKTFLLFTAFYYRKYPNSVRTQAKIISDPNPLWKIIFKVPNLVRISYFFGSL